MHYLHLARDVNNVLFLAVIFSKTCKIRSLLDIIYVVMLADQVPETGAQSGLEAG